AVEHRRPAVERTNTLGMLDALAEILRQARIRYRETVEVTVRVEDPYNALPRMRQPFVTFLDFGKAERALTYLPLTGPGAFRVRLPAKEYFASAMWCYTVLPDVHDEVERVG